VKNPWGGIDDHVDKVADDAIIGLIKLIALALP
jgi:hypothetical protein